MKYLHIFSLPLYLQTVIGMLAVLMVAQALGLSLSISEQINMALLGLLATLGVAGVPEAGVIALTILMTSANLPAEVIPLLLTVDWIVARVRSVTNVLGDMAVSIAVDGKPTSAGNS